MVARPTPLGQKWSTKSIALTAAKRSTGQKEWQEQDRLASHRGANQAIMPVMGNRSGMRVSGAQMADHLAMDRRVARHNIAAVQCLVA